MILQLCVSFQHFPFAPGTSLCFALREFYFEKNRVFQAGYALNTAAWNNEIDLHSYFVGFEE